MPTGWNEKNPERRKEINRRSKLKTKYGMTLADFDRMRESQGDQCATCSRPVGPKGLYIDHCHATGRVRGLLCEGCNTALGMASDDIGILTNLIRYLGEASNGF